MIKIFRVAGLLAIAFGASACVGSDGVSQNNIVAEHPYVVVEPPIQQISGNTEYLQTSLASMNRTIEGDVMVAPVKSGYRVTRVVVVVPQSLTVSEANSFVPKADIVWREDPAGDRRAQVKTILENAIMTGAAQVDGEREVIMSVRVRMFHALSQKARYTVGGRHNIQFDYVLLDARTGDPLTGVNPVDGKLKAFGGRRAIEAEARGDTQKVRISRYVAGLVYEKLKDSTAI